jgi:hypothetical protein
VNVWLWPWHVFFAVCAGVASGFAELSRPPAPTPGWLSDESINEFLDHHKWPDPWAEEQS